MLIVRELLLGGRRFSGLRASLPGISANVLTQRLAGLEQTGVLTKRKLPPPASAQIYELTPWGYEAEGPICALSRWAVRSPLHDPSLSLSATALMLSMKTMFVAGRADGVNGAVGFCIGDDGFVAWVEQGQLVVRRGDPAEAKAVIETAPSALLPVIYGGMPLSQAAAATMLSVSGDQALAVRFLGCFALPPKIG
ncbi:winged helix-turn-helix transcriptional regulator [Stakelama sediminis]